MDTTVNAPRDRTGHTGAGRLIPLLIALAVWMAIGVARTGFDVRPGLRAHFYAATDWTGEPAKSSTEDTIDTGRLSRAWGFLPPDAFSARWSGYIFTNEDATYVFSTTSDDGSAVYLDGQVVVDSGGRHGATTRSGRVHLARGTHALVVTYVNEGGGYEMHWAWAREGEATHAVAGWRLSVRPRGYVTLLAVRALDWLWPLAGIAVLALAARLVVVRGWWPRHADETHPFVVASRPAALFLAVFVAAAVVHTWPLATNPAHLSRNDNADTMLNEWAIAWVAHELPRSPRHLFDANTFYPERTTLAYSEALLVQSVMALPLFWAGASPVLAYNVVLLAGFALTGWATCLLVARWTEDWLAGLATGLMVAFNAHTLTRLPHLQAQHAEFLPLALLALDRLLGRPTWKAALALALCFVLQALASVYLLVFTAIALAVGFLVRPEDWANRGGIDVVSKIAAAGVLASGALVPFLLPYWQVKASGLARSLDEAAFYAATWRDYLTTQARWHPWTGGSSALFPGVVALALAATAIWSGRAFRDARARMCLAFAVVGVVLSFGPAIAPGYEFFFSAVPLLQAIRTSSRFGYLGLVGVAMLGGFGFAAIRQSRAIGPPTRRVLSVLILALVFLDPLAAPISYVTFDGISPIYRIPAADEHSVVAELPLAPPERQFRDASAILRSTENWRPLVNGYSGLTPPGYVQRFIAMNEFPAAESVAALQRTGVTHLYVHTDQYDATALEAIRRDPALHQLAADGTVVLYALARPADYR